MADARNYMAWILNAFGPYLSGPVLEIGVGHGSYASELRAHGHYMGVNVDIKSVAERASGFLISISRLPTSRIRLSQKP